MIKVLFSDVDRTILTSSYKLPDTVRDKLKSLSSEIHVVLATARSPLGVREVAARIGADYAICFNGGWIGKPSDMIALQEQPLELSLARSIMKTAQELGVSCLWYDGHSVLTLDRNALVEREGAITGETVMEVENVGSLARPPFKIMCTREKLDDDSFNALRQIFSSQCSMTASNDRLLEIAPQSASKGNAASWLANYFGISSDNCAAVGDAENDISMLTWAGVPLAVENAIPECIELAKFVAPSVEVGGMAHVVGWIFDANGR